MKRRRRTYGNATKPSWWTSRNASGAGVASKLAKKCTDFQKKRKRILSPTALTVIEERGDKFVRRMCMHCQDPACASACLVGALKKTSLGPVTYDGSKCIGCRYCLVACPFSVPRYEWSKLIPYVKKCDMCAARQANGAATGMRRSVSHGRIDCRRPRRNARRSRAPYSGRAKYVKHIYGSEEAGGTSVFFISDVPFEKLGFVAAPTQPMPTLTATALGDVPTVVLVGGALLSGLYWITERRPCRAVAVAETNDQGLKVHNEFHGSELGARRRTNRKETIMTRALPRLTMWRVIVAAIFAVGLYATYARFFLGFQQATNLTDPQPWGLWVGLGTLCGVGLSAGGFGDRGRRLPARIRTLSPRPAHRGARHLPRILERDRGHDV